MTTLRIHTVVAALCIAVGICCGARAADWGRALRFDGGDDCARVPVVSGIPAGNAQYTEELWLKIDGWSDWGGGYNGFIISRGGEGSCMGSHLVLLNHHAGLTHWGLDTDTGVCVEYDKWFHMATTWDGMTERLYINGELRWQHAWGPLAVSVSGITFGKHANYPSYYFSGEMDEVRVWSLARTEYEIQRDYLRQIQPDSPGLIGYWKFDEDGGQVIADSCHGNAGYLGSTVSVEDSDPVRVTSGVPRVVGISNRTAGDLTRRTGTGDFRYTVWGKATITSGSTLLLDDGSGCPIVVTAPGYTGVSTGDYAAATGSLGGTAAQPTLSSSAGQVRRIR